MFTHAITRIVRTFPEEASHSVFVYGPGGQLTVGDAGVDLFFVISGFIMFYVHQKEFGQPGAQIEFTTKRLLRIVPTYWFLTTIAVFILNICTAALHYPLCGRRFTLDCGIISLSAYCRARQGDVSSRRCRMDAQFRNAVLCVVRLRTDASAAEGIDVSLSVVSDRGGAWDNSKTLQAPGLNSRLTGYSWIFWLASR